MHPLPSHAFTLGGHLQRNNYPAKRYLKLDFKKRRNQIQNKYSKSDKNKYIPEMREKNTSKLGKKRDLESGKKRNLKPGQHDDTKCDYGNTGKQSQWSPTHLPKGRKASPSHNRMMWSHKQGVSCAHNNRRCSASTCTPQRNLFPFPSPLSPPRRQHTVPFLPSFYGPAFTRFHFLPLSL